MKEKIRRIKEGDEHDLHELFPLSPVKEIKDYLDECLEEIEKGKRERLVLTLNEKIIAQCQIDYFYYPHAHLAEIVALVIHPEYRRKGYAEKLMKEIEKMVKEKGKEILILSVDENNTPAMNLYKKLGYKQYGYFEKHMKKGEKYHNSFLMKKEI